MKRVGFALGIFALGAATQHFFDQPARPVDAAAAQKCSMLNGDVNADGKIDLSDPVTVLGNLFLGSPAELVPLCDPPALTTRIAELEGELADRTTRLQAAEAELASCLARPVSLPDTGQTRCYDVGGLEIPCNDGACPGQDGDYSVGCPAEDRFTDNNDGTVTDHCTGLMWQKNSADVDRDGQVTEQDGINWCGALNYCESLEFAGHDDWRLPSVRELQSIADYDRANPAMDPAFTAFLTSFYWTSTTYFHSFGLAWVVKFDIGYIHYGGGKSSNYFVRAVRTAR